MSMSFPTVYASFDVSAWSGLHTMRSARFLMTRPVARAAYRSLSVQFASNWLSGVAPSALVSPVASMTSSSASSVDAGFSAVVSVL